MMTLSHFQKILKSNPDNRLLFKLPQETEIPRHFHITEVGHVKKDFIDCGGTPRSISTCVLQAWVADDTDHALSAGKLLSILTKGSSLFPQSDIPVEIEFDAPYISQFPIQTCEITRDSFVFKLEPKHTDCLAKDKCGVEATPAKESCCSGSTGCC